MIPSEPLLVHLVKLVDRVPDPPQREGKRSRGRQATYSDKLFLKALLIMSVCRLHKVGELLWVLEQPTPEMQQLRQLLHKEGAFPSRRTFERRLAALTHRLPEQIGAFGRFLVERLEPWEHSGRAVAIDSTVLRAQGGVWHKKDRAAGVVPPTRIDTQAHWTKSGWHGWVYGWKLHLCCSAGDVWIPLAADLTAANVADNEKAPELIAHLPLQRLFVLGDLHDNAEEVDAACFLRGDTLVTTQYGRYAHTDAGVEVRRVFHKLRSVTIENFNEHFKAIFSAHEQVPTKGLVGTKRFALGALFVYQLALFYRFEQQMPLRVGLKPFLKAA